MEERKKLFLKWLEIEAVYAIIFLIDITFKTNFFKMAVFNPYWIAVLFYSIRSDTKIHLISLGNFVAFFFISHWVQNTPITFNISISNSIVVVLSLAVSIINEARIHTIEKLNLSIMEKDQKIEKLQNIIENQKITIEHLKETIFYEGEGISALFLKLRDLPIDNPQKLYQGFVEIITEFFEIGRISIYKFKNGFFRFIAGKGEPLLGFSFKENTSIVVKNALQKGFSTIRDLIEEKKNLELNREPWIAVKIGDEDEIYGVIVVEDIDPIKVNKSYEKYLLSMAAWLHTTMKKLELFNKEMIRIHRKDDGSFDEEYYKMELERLEELKKKYGIPYSEICLCIKKDRIKELFSMFRADDVFMRISEKDGAICYKVLLSMCGEVGKQKIIERLKGRFSDEIELCEAQ